MEETLTVTHRLGHKLDWQFRHAGGAGARVIAAVAACVRHPRRMFDLRVLWRLRRLFGGGAARLDPAAVRFAFGFAPGVRLRGVRFELKLATGARGKGPSYALDLEETADEDRLPPPGAGLRWHMLAFSAASHDAYRAMAQAIAGAPRETPMTLVFSARDSHVPPALRTEFPIQAAAVFDADEGYVPLVKPRTVRLEPPARAKTAASSAA